jgi:hypothetical protein
MIGLKLAGIGTAALAMKKLVSALVDMVHTTMGATYAVDKFTTQTGLSRRELKQWERVAELSDVKAEELQETLKQLQQRSRSIEMTGQGMNAFYGLLGISPHEKPTEFLKHFANRTKDMDANRAVFLGSQVGISEGMVYMLRKNADRIDELMQGTELSDQEHASVMKLNEAWREMTFNLGLLRDKLVTDLAPALGGIISQLDNWVKILMTSKEARQTAGNMVLSGGPMNFFGSELLKYMANAGPGHHGTTISKIENNIDVSMTGTGDSQRDGEIAGRAIQKELNQSYYGRPPPYTAQ